MSPRVGGRRSTPRSRKGGVEETAPEGRRGSRSDGTEPTIPAKRSKANRAKLCEAVDAYLASEPDPGFEDVITLLMLLSSEEAAETFAYLDLPKDETLILIDDCVTARQIANGERKTLATSDREREAARDLAPRRQGGSPLAGERLAQVICVASVGKAQHQARGGPVLRRPRRRDQRSRRKTGPHPRGAAR